MRFLNAFFGLLLIGLAFCESYSIFQITDIHVEEDDTKARKNLENVISHLNSIKESHNVKFGFVTGDFTDLATDFQWEYSLKELSKIDIPWLPVIGNHDIWKHNTSKHNREKFPTGDHKFMEIFGKKIKNFPEEIRSFKDINDVPILIEYDGDKKIHDPDLKIYSYYQNYMFLYDKYLFLILDWCSRKDGAPIFHGPVPWSAIHNFEGGTFEWLNMKIQSILKENIEFKEMLLIQHHPYKCRWWQPCAEVSFSSHHAHMVEELFLKQKFPMNKLYGDISGHIHEFNDFEFWEKQREWQGASVKKEACFSIINIEDNKIISIEKHIL